MSPLSGLCRRGISRPRPGDPWPGDGWAWWSARPAGQPVEVGALLVAGTDAAVGRNRPAFPHLAHGGVEQRQGPRAHLRNARQGDSEVFRDIGQRFITEEIALDHFV